MGAEERGEFECQRVARSISVSALANRQDLQASPILRDFPVPSFLT